MKLTTLMLAAVLSMTAWCSAQDAPAASKPIDPTAWWTQVDPSAARMALRHWMRIEFGLDRIAKDHPKLSDRARALKSNAASAYNAAAEVIDKHFARVDKEWREDVDDYKQHLAKQGTPSEPEEFLKEVERGLKAGVGGEAELLLAFAPRYAERPLAEIEDGFTVPLSTRGLAGAKGVDLSMVLPRSWMFEEPANERIALARHSHAGAGEVLMTLIVADVPADELKQIKEQGGAKVLADPDSITQAGGTLVKTGMGTIGKEEAAWTRYLLTADGEGSALKVLVWSIHAFHDGKYVNLQFQLMSKAKDKSGLAGDDAMRTRFEHYRPLLEKIVGSAAFAKPDP